MLISIVLISKNKLSGTIILTIVSIAYYGPSLLAQMKSLSSGVGVEVALQSVINMVCVIIPIAAFFIVAFAKEQEKAPTGVR